jgi:UDP-glucose 4-epimerase
MATHRLIEASLTNTVFPLFGDGLQKRDFTFVGDVVEANLLAAITDVPAGSVYNVAGGCSISMLDLIDLVASQTGKAVRLSREPFMHGDAAMTGGDISKAQQDLGWRPSTDIEQGVKLQVAWHLASRRG